jgi:hypothetical protein
VERWRGVPRVGQAQADLSVWGDGDGEVAERFITRTFGFDAVPGAIPFLAPPGLGQVRRIQVVADLGQPLATLHHMHTMAIPVGGHAAQCGAQPLQPTLLLKPFALSCIPLRQLGLSAPPALPSGEGIAGRCRESLLDGGDRRPQPGEVAVLGVAGCPVLIIGAGDDRVGPARTRLRSQRLLAGVEPVPALLPLRREVDRWV